MTHLLGPYLIVVLVAFQLVTASSPVSCTSHAKLTCHVVLSPTVCVVHQTMSSNNGLKGGWLLLLAIALVNRVLVPSSSSYHSLLPFYRIVNKTVLIVNHNQSGHCDSLSSFLLVILFGHCHVLHATSLSVLTIRPKGCRPDTIFKYTVKAIERPWPWLLSDVDQTRVQTILSLSNCTRKPPAMASDRKWTVTFVWLQVQFARKITLLSWTEIWNGKELQR